MTPSTIHVHNTSLSNYFYRYLMQKAMSVYKWEIPERWNREYFLYSLYENGFVSVINTAKFGVIPQHCTLYGYDVFYCPTHAIISNPLLNTNVQPQIGIKTELIKMMPDYGSIRDLVFHFADLMALTSQTISTNILNSKLSWAFSTTNSQTEKAMMKLYDRFASGEPAIFYNKEYKSGDIKPWEAFQQNVGQNYISDRLLSDLRRLENMFCGYIGIHNGSDIKQQRQTQEEINVNNIETISLAELWLDTLKQSINKVNKMFDINISVDWRINPRLAGLTHSGGGNNESNNISNGAVYMG